MATVVELEAAWLAADPAVTAALLVVPYARRQAAGVKRADVLRERLTERRQATGRKEQEHRFLILIRWPLTSGAARVEDDQQQFDVAVDAVLARIRGDVADKTHGGLFASVGEETDDAQILVEFRDPEAALEAKELACTVRYSATSHPISG